MRHTLTSSLRASLIASLAVTLALAISPAASASAVDVTDPAGDLMKASQRFVFNDCEDEDDPDCVQPEPEPDLAFEPSDDPVGDVVTTHLTHARRAIRVATTYRDLTRPTGNRALEWRLFTRGANGQRRAVSVATDQAHPGGVASMERWSNGQPMCRGKITRRIDYAANTINVSFPRWCVGKPLRIKLTGFTTRLNVEEQEDSATVEQAFDNAHRDGGNLDFPADLVWTRWLRRG